MKPAEYNDDELMKHASKLSAIEKKEVFEVPANYFDSLSSQLTDKISVTPALEEITVSNPFTVPQNYFEGLPLDMIKKIEAAQSQKFSLAALLAQSLRPKYSLSLITACFALFICIRFFEKPISLNVQQTAVNVSISEADVLGEVDENTLMNVMSEESAVMLKTSGGNKNTKDKNIEDYIINNNIDVADIAKEL